MRALIVNELLIESCHIWIFEIRMDFVLISRTNMNNMICYIINSYATGRAIFFIFIIDSAIFPSNDLIWLLILQITHVQISQFWIIKFHQKSD